jgi:selenide,water dikinase
VLSNIAPGRIDELMLGFETSDDAAIYRLSPELAAVLTVDFFTPIVDDPYDFGRIAAANSLSDVYAMGGRPLTAMNLLAFPCSLGPDIVGEVVRGGADKVAEAGAVTVGGHTIDDKEPKYGLSVMGVIDPDKVVRNSTAQAGDAVFLTKPVGTGVMATAIKRGLETEASAAEVIESMAALNRDASEAMLAAGVHAATDVTGFGLLGHLHEMAKGSGLAAWLSAADVPLFDRALAHAADGVVPGRTTDLIEWAAQFATWQADGEQLTWQRLLLDPQTSGGLLIAIAEENAGTLADELAARGVLGVRVGGFAEGESGTVVVR